MKLSVILCTALVLHWVRLSQAGPVGMVDHTEEEVNDLEHSDRGVDQDIKSSGPRHEEDINSKLPKEIKEKLYQGDIRLTPEQKEAIEEMEKEQEKFGEGGVVKRAVVRVSSDLWPNAVVPYAISSSLGSAARNVINAAIAEYERKTCINFVPRTTQRDYVYFIRDDGCYSYIGRTRRRQEISIGRGCEYIEIVLHEIFHALGRWHEQSRPDRDRYIRVNYGNVRRGASSEFEKLSFSEASTNNIGYDHRSFMHYSAYAFSRNGRPTIEPLTRGVSLSELGQRETLSDEDLQHALNLYCGGQQQGTWSAWTQWSPCSVTCGSGSQTRIRTCQGGTNCPGSSTDTRACNTIACPRWSSWSSWSVCSVTCGTGSQTRSRACVGGTTCPGSSSETRPCTVDCSTWSSWSAWTSCSVTCGSGSQTRTRTCQGGNRCVGSASDTRTCNTNTQCPRWSSWSGWSSCSVTCGTGEQQRTRTCIGTGQCPGSNTDTRTCNTGSCPGVWTGWSQWSSCSADCGAGTQTRMRNCVGGVCNGDATQERDCVQIPLCLTTLGQWGPWGTWSSCSATCGFWGTQTRTRTCSTDSCIGPSTEVQQCNRGSCPSQLGSGAGYGPWIEMSTGCSRSCGGGFIIRRRQCVNWPCSGRTIQVQGCNYQNCPTPAPPTVAALSPPFTARSHSQLSCKVLNIRAGVPELHTLNNEPLTTNIVQGCVDLAAASGFQFVGVTGGYCISGSNTETDYSQLSDSMSCTGGTGSFSPTSLLAHMDLYSITPV